MMYEGEITDMDDLFDESKDDETTNDETTNNKVSNALTQSYNNPTFEANYNIEANLNEGANFQAAEDPALREIASGTADEVPNFEKTKIQLDLAGKADKIAKEELKKKIITALVGAKGWDGVTETGLDKLAASKHLKESPGGSLWAFSSKERAWVQITQEKTKGKFFAESSLKGRLGESSARYISELIRTPDPPPGQPDSASSTVLPAQAEFHDLQSEDFSQSTRLLADRTPNINRIFNDSSSQTPKQVLDQLINVPEEELKASGFTDHAIAEWKGMKKASDSISSVKAFKDITLVEIDNELKELHEQFLREDDPVKRVKIGERIVDVENHRKEELHKFQQLFTEEESQFQRIKRLFRDAFMNDSQRPLKERLKRLYKVEGLTIAFAISAITMFFSTLGLSISNSLRGGGGGGGGGGSGGDKPPSIPDRVKEGLKKFAEWLKELAKKSAASLPGVIVSIVYFILKATGAIVGFLAQHIVIFLALVISSIIYGLIEGVKLIKNKQKYTK